MAACVWRKSPEHKLIKSKYVMSLTRLEGMELIRLALAMDPWLAVVNTAMNLSFPSNVGRSLSCLGTLSFSNTRVFLGVSCTFTDI